MKCDKCNNNCQELRKSDYEPGRAHVDRLCKDCWGTDNTYSKGKKEDYIKANSCGTMIGQCDECDRKRVSLRIYEEQEDTYKYEELEADGAWEFRYINTACCDVCYNELKNYIDENFLALEDRIADEDETDEDDDEEDEHPCPDPINPDAPPYGNSSPEYEPSPEYEAPPVYDEPEETFNYNWKPIMAKL
jgi:hypothetical protein